MVNRKIHIEHLNIRLPRGMVSEARTIAGELGRETLKQIAEATTWKTGTKRIGELSAGKITATEGARVGNLQQQIAGRVTDQLRKNFESGGK